MFSVLYSDILLWCDFKKNYRHTQEIHYLFLSNDKIGYANAPQHYFILLELGRMSEFALLKVSTLPGLIK